MALPERAIICGFGYLCDAACCFLAFSTKFCTHTRPDAPTFHLARPSHFSQRLAKETTDQLATLNRKLSTHQQQRPDLIQSAQATPASEVALQRPEAAEGGERGLAGKKRRLPDE